MFTYRDIEIEIDSVGSLIVNQLSYDLKGEPEIIDDINGSPCAFRFKSDNGGSLKITIDTDLLVQFFAEIPEVEIGIIVKSKISKSGISWLTNLFRSTNVHISDTSKMEFRCIYVNMTESISAPSGIRQTSLDFVIIGFKINDKDFLWGDKIGQFSKGNPEKPQLKIDEKVFDGVLVDLSYDVSLEHEKKDVDGSSVSYRIIKGFNEGTLSLKFKIFDSYLSYPKKTKEQSVIEWKEFFIVLEEGKEVKIKEAVRYVEHPSLSHNYYIFTNLKQSNGKDFIQLDLDAIEYQAIDRDKLKPMSELSPVKTSATSTETEVSPSGIVKKEKDPLITMEEMIKQAAALDLAQKAWRF